MHNALDVMQRFELHQCHPHKTPTKKAANAAFLSLFPTQISRLYQAR